MGEGHESYALKSLIHYAKSIHSEGRDYEAHFLTQIYSQSELENKIDLVANSPQIIQNFVEKQCELRITIVGDQIFACAIDAQKSKLGKIDWRIYDTSNTSYTKFDLPVEIQEKCLKMLKCMDLSFGCIDMILTPGNEYIFLEINPNGQWLWIAF